jgi:hypothetical protein
MGNGNKRSEKGFEPEGLPFKINEGDGGFYGPKIDFHLGGYHRLNLAVRNDSAGFPDASAASV